MATKKKPSAADAAAQTNHDVEIIVLKSFGKSQRGDAYTVGKRTKRSVDISKGSQTIEVKHPGKMVEVIISAQRSGMDLGDLAGLLKRVSDNNFTSTLSDSEEAFLDEFSGVEPSNPRELLRARLTAGLVEQQLRTDALSVSEAAELLGVSSSRVRQMLGDSLYALPTDEGAPRRLPQWQFIGGRPIPHLGKVADALGEVHPIEVRGFVENAIVESADVNMSVGEWLMSDGPIEPVLELAGAVARGL